MRDRPPGLATALLKRFGPNNDALAGDLREAYFAGKSAWWTTLPLLILLGGSLSRRVRPRELRLRH